jgi:enoyl-CoA hydratase
MEAALMSEQLTMTSPDHIRIVNELAAAAARRAGAGGSTTSKESGGAG